MDDKLDLILKNQEILNKNQWVIFREILVLQTIFSESDKKEFIRNYLADLVGAATAVLAIDPIVKDIKAKL